ncbi:TIGR02452 family protein [Kitasatospora nipponensis]|uniref:TIGR02452 family protein n=1 Tax=Kitasatospora nipponensis TaxID=258049 RepID=A0ABN1T7H0_9ACTN
MARENEEIAERGTYRGPGGVSVTIGGLLAAARAGTVSYTPEESAALLDEPSPGPGDPAVEVTAEGSLQAADRLVRSLAAGDGARGGETVAVLNFASARNPGGGYLRGSRAQEEDLCRGALLYRCLLAAPDYYEAHRASDDLRYSHRIIFSPGVPVIRDEKCDLLARPYPVSFLTSPAPNATQLRLRSQDVGLAPVLAERAKRLLAVAARHEVRHLVLGAWGCGVFGNDPAQVAQAFAVALESYGGAFEHVVFAVWDRQSVSANRAAFAQRFAGGGRRGSADGPGAADGGRSADGQ